MDLSASLILIFGPKLAIEQIMLNEESWVR